ncbi:MAG: hypothetical protein DWQ34_20955 [Planctomycetota bacterium]|nr:MAG: hypothetical protein DWQ34_20955 [Planctomycetota bacterium]REK21624.1 MAG: hypothetical protein DWQ41_20775 [Planctomycetota bacterium]REK29983.1 MAG: hypothetical protein DWQ45_22160 [Planctomycetota bacterium]
MTLFDHVAEIEHRGPIGKRARLLIHSRNDIEQVLQSLIIEPTPKSIRVSEGTAPTDPHQLVITPEAGDVAIRYIVKDVSGSSQYIVRTSKTLGRVATRASHHLTIQNGTMYDWKSTELVLDRSDVRMTASRHLKQVFSGEVVLVLLRDADLEKSHITYRIREELLTDPKNFRVKRSASAVFPIKAAWPKGWDDPGPIRFVYLGEHVGTVAPFSAAFSDSRVAQFDEIRGRELIEMQPDYKMCVESRILSDETVAGELPFGVDTRRFHYERHITRRYTNNGDDPVNVVDEASKTVTQISAGGSKLAETRLKGTAVLTLPLNAESGNANALHTQLTNLHGALGGDERLLRLLESLEQIETAMKDFEQFLEQTRRQIWDESAAGNAEAAAELRRKHDRARTTLQLIIDTYNRSVVASSSSDETFRSLWANATAAHFPFYPNLEAKHAIDRIK